MLAEILSAIDKEEIFINLINVTAIRFYLLNLKIYQQIHINFFYREINLNIKRNQFGWTFSVIIFFIHSVSATRSVDTTEAL